MARFHIIHPTDPNDSRNGHLIAEFDTLEEAEARIALETVGQESRDRLIDRRIQPCAWVIVDTDPEDDPAEPEKTAFARELEEGPPPAPSTGPEVPDDDSPKWRLG